MYLLIVEGANFWFQSNISHADKILSENDFLLIINTETKEYHVEGDIWQKIQER